MELKLAPVSLNQDQQIAGPWPNSNPVQMASWYQPPPEILPGIGMNPYYPTQVPGLGRPIETQPTAYPNPPAHGPVIGFQNQTISTLDNLGFLEPYTELYLVDKELLVVDVNGDFVLRADQEIIKAPRTYRNRGSAEIPGSHTSFLTQAGQIVFTSTRKKFNARVSSREFTLGEINSGYCRHVRSYEIKSKTGGPKFDLKPTGSCAGVGHCCWNPCCLNHYLIYSSDGQVVGSFTCANGNGMNSGPRHKISFEVKLDAKSKALFLAAAIVIYDLYFAPGPWCCGRHVGIVGTGCSLGAVIIPIFILIVVLVVLFGNGHGLKKRGGVLTGHKNHSLGI